MENTVTAEEYEETEETCEPSGSLTLNGEAWKNRDNPTYTSLLDRYGAADLFSGKNTGLYKEMKEELQARQQALTEYVFSGQMQTKGEEEDMVELVFSQEIRFTKLKDYSRKEDDYSICFVMAEILFVLIFLYVLLKVNAHRKKRRESHAVEINLEN